MIASSLRLFVVMWLVKFVNDFRYQTLFDIALLMRLPIDLIRHHRELAEGIHYHLQV